MKKRIRVKLKIEDKELLQKLRNSNASKDDIEIKKLILDLIKKNKEKKLLN